MSIDISVNLLNLTLKNPLMPASGPLVRDSKNIKKIAQKGVGAIVTKTISDKAAKVARPMIYKIESGLMNCELWSEDEPEKWYNDYLPELKKDIQLPIIISAGYTPEQLKKVIPNLNKFASAYELSTHYLGFDPSPVYNAAKTAKQLTDKPVFIKLSPHVPDIGVFAKAAVEGGADGIVAINSVGPGLRLNIKKAKPFLGAKDGYGWLSGPIIKPIALRAVFEISKAVNVPIIGVGGIETAEDVIEFMMVGATAVQLLSSAILKGLDVYSDIIDKLPKVLENLGYKDIKDIIGIYRGQNAKI